MTAPISKPKESRHRSFAERATRWVLGAIAVLFLACMAAVLVNGSSDEKVPNELGLSRSDLKIGGPVNLDDLRSQAEAAAEKYLSEKRSEISGICGGGFTASPDYSLTSSLRKMGYRSSFYYHCWDIYLPFRLRTDSGSPFLAIVQVSDKKDRKDAGFGKFEVLRCIILDESGHRKGQLENR